MADLLILDRLDEKDAIGKSIAMEMNKGADYGFIVSPYVSEVKKSGLDLSKINSLKIICNARSSSCNPNTLQSLIKDGIEIRSRNDIHAKVYIIGEVAFLGSANASPNGLGTGTIEAAVKLTNNNTIAELKSWHKTLWDYHDTENVNDFTESDWEQLKAQWRLRSLKRKSKPKLSDLILTKNIPENIAFCFWYDTDDSPDQKVIKAKADEDDQLELPNSMSEWDFWIEDDSNSDYKLLEEIQRRNYNNIMINIKITDSTTTKAFHVDNFQSKLIGKPIVYRWKGKDHLLSLYRTNGVSSRIAVDRTSIRLINDSLKRSPKKWNNHFTRGQGVFGYCSKAELYKLLADN
jgi:PLD-like domain